MKVTINKIRVELQAVAEAHEMINSFFWGDFHRSWNEESLTYPLVCGYVASGGSLSKNLTNVPLTIVVADKVFKDYSSLNDTESDTLQVCRHIFNTLNMSPRWNALIRVNSASVEKFIDRGSDEIAGHILNMNVDIKDSYSICNLPMGDYDFESTAENGCAGVLIVNSDGTFNFTAPSGSIVDLPDTPVTVRNVSGDEVGSGDVPSVTGGVVTVPDCPVSGDGTAVLKDTDGNVLSTTSVAPETTVDIIAPDADYEIRKSNNAILYQGSIPSGSALVQNIQDSMVRVRKSDNQLIAEVDVRAESVENYNVADSTAVLKDSAGTIISTTSIKATESEDITAPDTTIQVNGVTEGTFAAGSTIDLQLTDGVNPVNPDSVTVVGNVVTAQVPAASTGWVRNPDWLPLPEITAADNRFVGLFLVFEGEYNQLALNLTNNAVNIDWGDGTSDVSNGAVQTKVYDYATIVSPVSQYYDGRNYKQIIVDLEYNGTGTWIYCHLSFNTGINNGGSVNFVDIDCSLPNVNNLFLSQQRKMTILEQLKVRTLANNSWNSTAVLMWKLRSLEFPFDKLTQMVNPTFQGVEHFGNIDLGNVLNAAIGFSGSTAISFGNINLSSSTSIQRLFEQAKQLIRVESIDCSSCTTIQQTFNFCDSLNYAVLNNCALIMITTNAFNACFNLSTLLLNGITVGFSIANCNLTDTALNDLFTSLGTASGSQTIVVTGNPGAATCDTTIATGKGFTVTT